MQVTQLARRSHGEILNCKYGHLWPLNLYSTGYVMILINTTAKGKIKMSHRWAQTPGELLQTA